MAQLFLLVGPRVEKQPARALGDHQLARCLVQRAADPPRPPFGMTRDIVQIAEPQIGKVEAEGKPEDFAPPVFGDQQNPAEITGRPAFGQRPHAVEDGDLLGKSQLEQGDNLVELAAVGSRCKIE